MPTQKGHTPYYDGTVMGVIGGRRRSRRPSQRTPSLEVYFAGDHSTCLLSHAQVVEWLLPPTTTDGGGETHRHR